MKEGEMDRKQKIKNCFECKYGDEECECTRAFCHEASRGLADMNIIPDWCPLPKWDDKETP